MILSRLALIEKKVPVSVFTYRLTVKYFQKKDSCWGLFLVMTIWLCDVRSIDFYYDYFPL